MPLMRGRAGSCDGGMPRSGEGRILPGPCGGGLSFRTAKWEGTTRTAGSEVQEKGGEKVVKDLAVISLEMHSDRNPRVGSSCSGGGGAEEGPCAPGQQRLGSAQVSRHAGNPGTEAWRSKCPRKEY